MAWKRPDQNKMTKNYQSQILCKKLFISRCPGNTVIDFDLTNDDDGIDPRILLKI